MGPDNGKPDGEAHGKLWHNKAVRYVHRVVYEIVHGAVPKGRHVDHICRVRMCCNPDHLEAVWPFENFDRGNGRASLIQNTVEWDDGGMS